MSANAEEIMLKQIAHHYEVYLHILYSNYSVNKQVRQ